MAFRPRAPITWAMANDDELHALLERPAVIAAVRELGVEALTLEDVLGALRRFGAVRINVSSNRRRPYACVVQVAGEDPEIGRGRTVLHAAVACWAATLESFELYTGRGVTDLQRYLAGLDGAA
jgi:hypothetical protein